MSSTITEAVAAHLNPAEASGYATSRVMSRPVRLDLFTDGCFHRTEAGGPRNERPAAIFLLRQLDCELDSFARHLLPLERFSRRS